MADLSESSWPGERIPSRYDVASANEIPDTEFVSAFKNALFSSSDAAGCQDLMHMDLRSHVSDSLFLFVPPFAICSGYLIECSRRYVHSNLLKPIHIQWQFFPSFPPRQLTRSLWRCGLPSHFGLPKTLSTEPYYYPSLPTSLVHHIFDSRSHALLVLCVQTLMPLTRYRRFYSTLV